MTDLAYACAVLELAVDPGRLYDCEDPCYLVWLGQIVDRVNARNRQEADKVKKRG